MLNLVDLIGIGNLLEYLYTPCCSDIDMLMCQLI